MIQRRNMIGFLGYGPDRYIVGIAAVAGFTISVDTTVREAGRRCEGRVGIIVALETVLRRGQMRECGLAGGNVAVVT